MSFGSVIRERRTALGIGLNDFAERLEISAAYWSRIERDQENPPRDELIERAAAILGVRMDDLFVDVNDRDWCHLPDERSYLSGVADLHQSQAWATLMNGSETINSFKAEPGRYISIEARGDDAGTIMVSRERLVVRHAERLRFEAEQEVGAATASSGAAVVAPLPAARGAAPRYDWDAFWAEALVSMFQDGPPATLAEYVRRMETWFADRGEHPDSSTIKKKLSQAWRRIAPHLERRRA